MDAKGVSEVSKERRGEREERNRFSLTSLIHEYRPDMRTTTSKPIQVPQQVS